ncbi:MAG: long-chain fatty acid--CoA ligase [Rhodospirillales bacterium]|nr:long-chain fatty acid--CoA ligase [Rhodospirillales bacterium]
MTEYPWLAQYPEHLDYFAQFEPKPLWVLWDDAVERYPHHPFIDFLGRRFSYSDIDLMIDQAAKGFQDIGVGPGVKVGLFLPNCPQFVVCFYGILKAGGTVVNYSPLYAEPELLHQIEDSHTDIMVTLNLEVLYGKMERLFKESRLRTLVVGTLSEVLPFPKNFLFPVARARDIAKVSNDPAHVSFRQLINNEGDYQAVDTDPSDIAVLQYTGGTTGVPKGAMLSHGAIYTNVLQASGWASEIEHGNERIMAVLPFFHVFALNGVMNLAIRVGGELIIHPRFELEPVLKDMAKKKPTFMSGVPTMFAAINGAPHLAKYDLSSLKFCLSGGAPMPGEIKSRFEKLASCKLVEGYGLTECSAVATVNPFEGLQKEGSIGLPVPGTRIVIVDKDDPSKVKGLGETGEICIEGPQLMSGYFGKEEATAEVLIDGRLLTGDVGYVDEDGFTFIIDRKKDMILAGGFNVFPRHIEEAIYQHPAVEEVIVIGIPHDYRGEAPKAFVKLKDAQENLTAENLSEFLRDRLGKHELPAEMEFRAELPKTLVGKLSKKELVAEEAAKREAVQSGRTGY